MRNARILRQELDLWKIAWQQVETFLQRIDDAQGQDETHRAKLDALLRASRAVEHARATRVGDNPLSDPIVDTMPTEYYQDEREADPIDDPWDLKYRKWRIPGMDEVELAVGNLIPNEDEEKVHLLPDQDIFEIRLDQSDRRIPASDDGLWMIRLPSYPRPELGDSIVKFGVVTDIKEEGHTSSLFSKAAREAATQESAFRPPPAPPTEAPPEPDLEQEFVRSWSNLCRKRRDLIQNPDDSVNYAGPSPRRRWKVDYTAAARDVIQDVRNGQATPGAARDVLENITKAARAAAATAEFDAQDLIAAADVIDREGAQQDDFLQELREAANVLESRPAVFRAVATAAAALLQALNSTESADRLERALDALDNHETRVSQQRLFARRVEDQNGLLWVEIDTAVQARTTYPDGTLRIVRAMEWGFLTTWLARLRWFKIRNQTVLQPILELFRKPFTDGVRTLVKGGFTQLDCEGLTVGQPTSVGSEALTTGQPATMVPTLRDSIETGSVGMLGGDRPAAIVILGLDESNDRVALSISPLIVSVAAEAEDVPGVPGLVTSNQPIGCIAPGLRQEELRRGESNSGRARDGVVHQAVALWSRLSLVFGWLAVEQALQAPASVSESQFDGRLIPDPSSERLRDLMLYGEVPARATSLVIQGASAYWDRSTYPPRPRIARPRELLLLRGRGESEDEDGQGPVLQSAVEVETVFRTTGSMLRRMDTTTAALLSTSPIPPGTEEECRLVCGPEEDVIVVTLRQSWQTEKLVDDITLRRDFLGFDAPSLATERLLPVSFLERILDSAVDEGEVDRQQEFDAARKLIMDWTRYAHE